MEKEGQEDLFEGRGKEKYPSKVKEI